MDGLPLLAAAAGGALLALLCLPSSSPSINHPLTPAHYDDPYAHTLTTAGVAPEDVYVVFNGKPLEEADLLSAAGVEEAATLNVLGRLLGGAKKRKKKTYTKPKKQKHKHKKIKLRVLKFYKVDDSGKVQRLRKQCPNCGPGTFMATHFDRVYCGKCTTTYLVEADKGGKAKGKK